MEHGAFGPGGFFGGEDAVVVESDDGGDLLTEDLSKARRACVSASLYPL